MSGRCRPACIEALAGRTGGPVLAKLGLLGAPRGREGAADAPMAELAVEDDTKGPVGMIVFITG